MTIQTKSFAISIEQLRVGMHVILDVSWLDHDFPRNSFKVKDAEQLAMIRQLGLRKVRIDPARSDLLPEPPAAASAPPVAEKPVEPAESPLTQAKRERLERINRQRAAVLECERQFLRSANALKHINSNLFARPQEAHERAAEMVDRMADSLLTERDIAIHLMKDKYAGEDMYFHSLNVAVLAMMLGRQLGLSKEEVRQLGFGSLFHDVGKIEIPDKVLVRTTPLTKAEQSLLEMHCAYGEPIARRLGLSEEALAIILQHHEYMDGSGYPQRLAGDAISPLARIVAIANTYDNLCNRPNPADSLSPHAALSSMFAHQRRQLDGGPLGVFIRCMGVYPPGTVVRLSDGTHGLVVSVNASQPLRPGVLIHDPEVPRSEAVILDLECEPELGIEAVLKPSQLPRDAFEYLAPRRRMSYYFDLPARRASKA